MVDRFSGAVAAVVLMCLAVAACGPEDSAGIPVPVESTRQARVDEGVVYYVNSDGLAAVDAREGRALWSVRPSYGPLPASGAPLLLEEAGPRVVAAFPVAGDGATTSFEVVSVDAADGRPVWRVTHEVETATDAQAPFSVVGAHDGTAVVTSSSSTDASYGIDLDSGAVTWHRESLRSRFVSEDTLVADQGVEKGDWKDYFLTGVDPATGRERWRAWERESVTDVVDVGGGRFLATSDRYVTSNYRTGFFDAATGTLVRELPRARRQTCRSDLGPVFVCWFREDGVDQLVGYDSATGVQAWALPRPGGPDVPVVASVHGGVLYGSAPGSGEPVLLDLADGDPTGARADRVPALSDGLVGLSRNGAEFTAHPLE